LKYTFAHPVEILAFRIQFKKKTNTKHKQGKTIYQTSKILKEMLLTSHFTEF